MGEELANFIVVVVFIGTAYGVIKISRLLLRSLIRMVKNI